MSLKQRIKDILKEAGRVMDLSGKLNTDYLMSSDTEALTSDWEQVGKDMYSIIGKYLPNKL